MLAAMLAIVWIAAGVAAVALGMIRHQWVPLLLGPLAIGYGALWIRVARTGRKLDAPWLKRRS
jgi:hypothetical protein